MNKYFNTADIEFRCCDFEESLKGIRKGAFVYFDPPYDPVSDSSDFTGYSKGGFDKNQQIRLRNLCETINEKEVKFLLSNSATEFILDLYREFNVEIIQAKRIINSKGSERGEIDEVLVRNYD